MSNQPNILFLLSDEHSFRCLGQRDDDAREPTTTPALDDLTANGTMFTDAYCQMPLCTPSRLCMLTGRNVRGAEVWGNDAVLPPDRPTLPRTLSANGYETCLVGKMHLGGSCQYAGYDHRPYGDLTGLTGHQWEPLDRKGGLMVGERTADAGVTEIPESNLQEYVTTREATSRIREQEHRSPDPWFLTASFSRPHFPLTAPRRYVERYWDDGPTDRLTRPKVGRKGDTSDHPLTQAAVEGFETADLDEESMLRARACYFACVEFLDDVVGEFLATLDRDGLLENTLVVYASDHGELAGEHGLWWKHTWHEASTRVPFVVQTPDQRRGDAPTADLSTPVSLADLFPTLAGFAGVEPATELDGRDLSEAIAAGEEPDRGPVISDNPSPRWGEGMEFRVVRDGHYKDVGFRDAPELLFDLKSDPQEQTNLAPDAEGETADILTRLREFVLDTIDFDAIVAERDVKADGVRADDSHDRYSLEVNAEPRGSGNCYVIDGTIIEADTPLYDPYVVTDDPADAFDDYPNGRGT